MKIILPIIILLIFPLIGLAGGVSEEVVLLSLSEVKKGEYVLKYKNIDKNKIHTLNIKYDENRYKNNENSLTIEKYRESIALLNKQLNKTNIRLGFMASAPCLVNPFTSTFRVDALEIFEEQSGHEVVYAFCKYN